MRYNARHRIKRGSNNMRNSWDFIGNFIPRVIVGLVLAITVCANAKAEPVAVLCAEQKKCFDEVKIEKGTCNYYTLGMSSETLEGCKEGRWYCRDDEYGECVTYSCDSCAGEKTFRLLSVNKQIVGKALCEYALYDGKLKLPTNGDACTNVSYINSCKEGYYLVAGSCEKCPSYATCPGNYEYFSCKEGYYAVEGGCDRCPSGTTSPAGAQSKEECVEVGKCPSECPFKTWTAAPSILLPDFANVEVRCVVGKDGVTYNACESRCAAGYFDKDTGTSFSAIYCSACPSNSTSQAGATDISMCSCDVSYYGSVVETGCLPCPPSYCNSKDPVNGDAMGYPECLSYDPNDGKYNPYMQGSTHGGGGGMFRCFIPAGTVLGDPSGTYTFDYNCAFEE